MKRGLRGAALLALVLSCYAPSLRGGFLWDDDTNVSENPALRSARGLVYIWTEPRASQQYYPLTYTSFWLEYRLWGPWPPGFRLTNLLLHATVAILLWRTLERLAVPGAWVAAAAFALHPVHVESVAWITERKNLLSAALYFTALLAHLRGRRALTLLFFVLALLSKTAVLTLPAALLVIAWWQRGRITRAELWPTLPLFAIGLPFAALTTWLEHGQVGAAGAAWSLGVLARLLVAARALLFYAGKLLVPLELNFIYPRWSTEPLSPGQFVPLAIVVAVGLLLWRLSGRLGRGPLAGLLVFAVTLAPALGFVDFYFQLYSFVQDHLQYLASAGLLATVVGLATPVVRRLPARVGPFLAAVWLAALGALTVLGAQRFTSEEALWTSVLAANPRAAMADINLGLLRERERRFDEAAERYRHAVDHGDGQRDKALNNLGRLFELRGRRDEAREQYRAAIAENPQNAEAQNNLGALLAADRRTDEALACFQRAVEAEPHYLEARYNLARQLLAQGLTVEAERELGELLRQNPRHVPGLELLGRVRAGQGRSSEAVELYDRVLALDPTRYETHYNLALELEGLARLPEAERHYREAIRLEPSFPGSHNNLAIVLYHEQRFAEAWLEVRRCQELGGTPHPDFLEALAAASPPPVP